MALLEAYRDVQIRYARRLLEILVQKHAEAYPKYDPKLSLLAAMLCDELTEISPAMRIHLLEIVENSADVRCNCELIALDFQATKQFPLQGRLVLTVVSPEEFEAILPEVKRMGKATFPSKEQVLKLTEHWQPLFDPTGYLRMHLGEPKVSNTMEQSGVQFGQHFTYHIDEPLNIKNMSNLLSDRR